MSKIKSTDAILERLENLKEDMSELKETVKLLQEDYVQRKSLARFIVWLASVVSAIASFVVSKVLDKVN